MKRQSHLGAMAEVTTVPTSDKPDMKEWTGHYWYVLRCGALQASPTLTTQQAADLVAWFKGFAISTPCPDCRAHFADDFVTYPFEETHARDPMQAMFWVEELRRRIEIRKAAYFKTAAAASATSATPTPHASVSAATPPSPPLSTPAPVLASASAPAPAPAVIPKSANNSRHSVVPMLPRTNAAASAMRKLAIQSAMQQTIANRIAEKAGVPRGCGCGKKKTVKPNVV